MNYLVGNPYPSALDADEFIKDNINALEANGHVQQERNQWVYIFWDHLLLVHIIYRMKEDMQHSLMGIL
jgi:hypothetical protein